jgi:hypothetical protein
MALESPRRRINWLWSIWLTDLTLILKPQLSSHDGWRGCREAFNGAQQRPGLNDFSVMVDVRANTRIQNTIEGLN